MTTTMQTHQTTLTGHTSIPRCCEQTGPCQRPARHEIEPFIYDGGWLSVTRAGCHSCTEAFLEPEAKTWATDTRRLKLSEHWTTVDAAEDA